MSCVRTPKPNSTLKIGSTFPKKQKLPDKDNPTYVVFFKAKNAEQVNRAFKHYAYNCTHSRDKPSVKKEIGDIVKQQEQAQDKNRQRTREKAQTKGMEH